MVIFLFLIFNIFSISFQDIEAVFFCDDVIKAVYVVDGTNEIQISGEGKANGRFTFNYTHLDAVPGDLIKFTCYSYGGASRGAGCFVLNDQCYCDNFEINKNHKYNPIISRSFNFGHITCSMSNILLLEEELEGNQDYQHYIPLDASKISCINNNNVLSIPYNENKKLKLSDYITADFDTKNVEVEITENYEYFKLNDAQLGANDKFKIVNDLTFKSEDIKKIKIKFINHGKIIDGTKECEFNIRVCHERCSDCYDKDPDENHHQCKNCRNGFYPLSDCWVSALVPAARRPSNQQMSMSLRKSSHKRTYNYSTCEPNRNSMKDILPMP